jgi:hypothetical protein
MANLSIKELLAQTTELRERFERLQPDSARLSILIRDEQRLLRMMAA